jgi:hypothetical protein
MTTVVAWLLLLGFVWLVLRAGFAKDFAPFRR